MLAGLPLLAASLAAQPAVVAQDATSRAEPAQEREDLEARLAALEARVDSLRAREGTPLRAFWRGGFRLETPDGAFRLRLGGRIHYDVVFLRPDRAVEAAVGNLEDGVELRRARFDVTGVLHTVVEYKNQVEVNAGGVAIKDMYLGLRSLPAGVRFRFGHFKEPIGLDELTSDNDTPFQERSLTTVFTPSRNTGLMFFGAPAGARLTWAAGVFRDTDDFGKDTGDGEYNFTARLTGLPWYVDEGRRLLHLGAAVSLRSPGDNTARFRQRPETHLVQRFLDTGPFASDGVRFVGVEGAVGAGPAWVQGEFIHARAARPDAADAGFSTSYLSAGYLLTGEHRPYRMADGKFGFVRPRRSFTGASGGGPGAWEVLARVSRLDLSDAGIGGGVLTDWTVGLNWYLNANSRVMWNVVMANLEAAGTTTIFESRFQVHF